MYPQPPQYSPTAYLRQFPVPGEVRSVAVMLWITAGISFTVLTINMVTAPMYGVELGYAFGYSFFHVLIGVLAVVPAVSVTRGRSWARTMTKVVLIIQIVVQSMMLIGGNNLLWAFLLLPMAIVGVVLLHRPVAKRFFAAHGQAADQEYAAQQGYGHQQPYPAQQGYGHRPPQNGTWGRYPHQR